MNPLYTYYNIYTQSMARGILVEHIEDAFYPPVY